MNRGLIAAALVVSLVSACGEDKNYGDPISDPNATQSALGAIANAQLLPSMQTNDSALLAVNGLSGSFNVMTGAKYQAESGVSARVDATGGQVDEACIVVTSTSITYDDCDFIGTVVSGTVSVDGSDVSIDVDFDSAASGITQTTSVRAEVEVSETAIDGFVDYDLAISANGVDVSTTFDGDFAVDLEQGCAVGGDLEVHAVIDGNGQHVSVWALAEYGPTCDDVTVY